MFVKTCTYSNVPNSALERSFTVFVVFANFQVGASGDPIQHLGHRLVVLLLSFFLTPLRLTI